MRTHQAVAICLVAFAACASAFAPQHAAFRPSSPVARSMSKSFEEVSSAEKSNTATLAAFATAFAPLAAFADLDLSDLPSEATEAAPAAIEAAAEVSTAVAVAASTVVDQATLIGYGAGLVACVTFFAVGFSIGYGTLVKP